MPYDPDDLYTAEPKLLSIDCFPTFFTPPAPPNYDTIMAGSTRYQRVSEEMRASMDSSTGNAELDAGLLLLDPMRGDDDNEPPKKEHKFSCHPTLFLRLICICLLVPAFVLFILSRRPRCLAAAIFSCIVIVRNVLVIIHHILSRHLRIRIEFRNGSPRLGKPDRSCPDWLKQGPLYLLLDLALFTVLLIVTIIATQGSYNWYYGGARNDVVVPACIIQYIGR